MIKKIISSTMALCFLISMYSCATIVSGRTQNVPVVSNPSGAIVTVGTQKQMTPATFILDKKQEYVVRVEKEGYESVEIIMKKGISGWIWGNIVFGLIGGPIGVVIDISNGSATKFVPSPIEVNLIEQKVGKENLNGKTILFVKLIESKQR